MPIEIEKSPFISVTYTVKPLKKDNNDCTDWFNRAIKLGCSFDKRYKEIDTRGKDHYHGIMYIPRGFWRKKLNLKNYHVWLKDLTHREGWMKYIQKDQDVNEAILDELIEQTKDIETPEPAQPEDDCLSDALDQCCLKLKKRIV